MNATLRKTFLLTALFFSAGALGCQSDEKPENLNEATLNGNFANAAKPPPIAELNAYKFKKTKKLSFEGLTDQNGNIVKDKDFEGKNLYVFFGYPDCKIVCIPAREKIKLFLKNENPENVQFVFVTIRPTDKPGLIKTWVDEIDPAFIPVGLGGDHKILQKLYDDLKIVLTSNKSIHDPNMYIVDKDLNVYGMALTSEQHNMKWLWNEFKKDHNNAPGPEMRTPAPGR